MMQPGAQAAMGQQYPPQAQQPYTMAPPPQGQATWQGQSAPPPQAQPSGAGDEIRTLWIGDLQYWMDESYLYNCFAPTGELVSVKVIRNKHTGQSDGYGFLEFNNRSAAERALQTYNGAAMPNGAQSFRLNWASAGEKRSDDSSPDFTVFVGDLASDVTDYMLQETFRSRYSSVKGAKVVIDRATGRAKGYGFVRFGDESEQVRALAEMNGVLCSTRPMRVGAASNKTAVGGSGGGGGGGQQYSKASYNNSQGAQNETDPNNTTIFVGNLDTNVTDDHLRQLFCQYGELMHVKIPTGKRCGFVQFAERNGAEEALRLLNGTPLGGQNIRLSWGRSPNKQHQQESNQWNGNGGSGGYYGGYGSGHEGYGGYPQVAAQDPNMYYGGYPAYGSYQQQQQPPQPQQQHHHNHHQQVGGYS